MTADQVRNAILIWAERETDLKFIFSDQDTPRPAIPYGEINFRNATRKVGSFDEFRISEDDGFMMSGVREASVDIEIIGLGANEKMSLLHGTLDRPDVVDEFDFAHVDEDGPFDLTSLEETKTRERCRLSLGIRYKIETDVNDEIGDFDTVVIEKEDGIFDGSEIEIIKED